MREQTHVALKCPLFGLHDDWRLLESIGSYWAGDNMEAWVAHIGERISAEIKRLIAGIEHELPARDGEPALQQLHTLGDAVFDGAACRHLMGAKHCGWKVQSNCSSALTARLQETITLADLDRAADALALSPEQTQERDMMWLGRNINVSCISHTTKALEVLFEELSPAELLEYHGLDSKSAIGLGAERKPLQKAHAAYCTIVIETASA